MININFSGQRPGLNPKALFLTNNQEGVNFEPEPMKKGNLKKGQWSSRRRLNRPEDSAQSRLYNYRVQPGSDRNLPAVVRSIPGP